LKPGDPARRKAKRAACQLLSLVLALSFSACASDLSDPSLTQGDIGFDFIPQNTQSTVCVNGYTKVVHPPAYYTNKLKKRQMKKYGCPDMNPNHDGKDHPISRSIVGNPHDNNSILSEPRNSDWNFDKKEQSELVIYRMICAQKIHACGNASSDESKLNFGVQDVCAWKSLSAWSWIWSCRLK
jgi:hypothetical protein